MISSYNLEYFIGIAILAITALTAPYLNDLLKRNSLAPKLKIIFHKESSYIRLYDNYAYDLFFEVKNEGNSKAKNCEVIIEELCYKDQMGNLIESKFYIPAKLIRENLPFDILPKASNFLKIFRIVRNEQNKIDLKLYIAPLVRYDEREKILTIPLSSYLKIKIVTYSENAKKCVQQIEISSPGIWRKDIIQILQELQITLS